jgi:hypothetical protein
MTKEKHMARKSAVMAEKLVEAAEKMLNSGADIVKQRKEQAETGEQVIDPFTQIDNEFKEINNEEKNDKPKVRTKSSYLPSADKLGRMPTHEEFCEAELLKAHDFGYEDPDFDFRTQYFTGQVLYYAYSNNVLMEKRIIIGKARTIYPRMIILSEEKGLCTCVGYNEKDLLFTNSMDAMNCLDNITLVPMTLDGRLRTEVYDGDDITDTDDAGWDDSDRSADVTGSLQEGSGEEDTEGEDTTE